MADWLIERGIGEDRALLVERGRVLAAKVRWPGEIEAGTRLQATLTQRTSGSPRGLATTADGHAIFVDRLPRVASEGARIEVTVTRAATAERGRFKRAQGRWSDGSDESIEPGAFDVAAPVRRFPAGLWEDVWSAAWDGEVAFPGGSLLFAVTPGMTVIDVDGDLSPRELAVASVPPIALALRQMDLGGSIGIDFPTLAVKAERKAVDAALERELSDWPHERTAMNGFGFVQLVARSTGPSLLNRLTHHRAAAAARFLLRQAEAVEGAGAILLAAHPTVIRALAPEWVAELARRTGREIRLAGDDALALDGGHAQIVPR